MSEPGPTQPPPELQRDVSMPAVPPRRLTWPLPGGSEWTFDQVERYDLEIARVAERYGLDTWPNQIEIISAEQMLDAYASNGFRIAFIIINPEIFIPGAESDGEFFEKLFIQLHESGNVVARVLTNE